MKKIIAISVVIAMSLIISEASERPARLLIFGASITAFRGKLNVAAFRVHEKLEEKGIKNIFFNSGVPGNTTGMGKKRFQRDVLGLYPDVVFVMFGTNDCAIDVWKGADKPRVKPENYRKNLEFFARELKKRGVVPVFMTIPPVYMTPLLAEYYNKPPYTEKGFNFMVDKYVKIIRETAKKEDVKCIDINRAFWNAAGGEYDNLEELFLDGMHPNNKGQKIIADRIMCLFEHDPEILKVRAKYGESVRDLEISIPAGKDNTFEIETSALCHKLEYRFKIHLLKEGMARDFGEWIKVPFSLKNKLLKGRVKGLPSGIYSLQFKTLDDLGRVSAVGNVSHVKITEELAVTDEKTELWNGYKLKKFLLNGCKCMIVEPEKALPGKPWIWRARFWGAWPYVDLALLKKGCHVAYIDVSNLYGSPKATRRFDMFYKYLTEKLGFLKKPVLEGYSRGGLIIYNWAARNPEKITCVYGDAPVCDFKSWPAKKSAVNWEKLKKVYGFENDAKALKYKGNPIDNLKPLAEAEVPIIHVAGDKDESVPIEENTNILAERYRKLGGNIKVIIKPGCGHHPHCLEDPEEIVDFILKSCKK